MNTMNGLRLAGWFMMEGISVGRRICRRLVVHEWTCSGYLSDLRGHWRGICVRRLYPKRKCSHVVLWMSYQVASPVGVRLVVLWPYWEDQHISIIHMLRCDECICWTFTTITIFDVATTAYWSLTSAWPACFKATSLGTGLPVWLANMEVDLQFNLAKFRGRNFEVGKLWDTPESWGRRRYSAASLQVALIQMGKHDRDSVRFDPQMPCRNKRHPEGRGTFGLKW